MVWHIHFVLNRKQIWRREVFPGHTEQYWQGQYNEQGLLTPSSVLFDYILFSWDGKVEMDRTKEDGRMGCLKFIQLPGSPGIVWAEFCDNSGMTYIRYGKNLWDYYPSFDSWRNQRWHWQHIPGIKVTDSLILQLSKLSFPTSALSDFPTPDTFAVQTLSILGLLLKILKENIFTPF